jgi:hypothetical protein
MELDGVRRLAFDIQLGDGEALVYEGEAAATVYSAHWQVLGTVPVDPAQFLIGPGDHSLGLEAGLEGADEAHLKIELRIWREPEVVRRR